MTDALFKEKAPSIMQQLMADFYLTVDETAAILGNIGQECGGFTLFQEQKPLVAGSKGGFGWCQWTGPRRRQFEAYVARNKLDPKSDKANYGWLFVELTTTEKKSIAALKKAVGLDAKVEAFEKSFERSGIPNYPARVRWAKKAIAAYNKTPDTIIIPTPPTHIENVSWWAKLFGN